MKILISGISGFLGSSIANVMHKNNVEIFALRRQSSDLTRCNNFVDEIKWIDILGDWEIQLKSLRLDVILHIAWEGVSAKDRDDWNIQFNNLGFTLKLLNIAKECNAKKFIGFGSQAEYGEFTGIIDESYSANPVSAYGLSKHFVSKTIELFCKQNQVNWYWFRLFSFFGENEAENWLIPTLIKNLNENKLMDMTPGDQRYAYMYVDDLAKIIYKVIDTEIESGIYNLSSENSISLKELVFKISKILKKDKNNINFGAMPYRKNQPMLIQGNVSKLKKVIGDDFESNFDDNLTKVVKYIAIKENYENI